MFVYLYSLYSRYKFEVLVLDAWVLVLVSVPEGSVLDTPLILSRPRPRPGPRVVEAETKCVRNQGQGCWRPGVLKAKAKRVEAKANAFSRQRLSEAKAKSVQGQGQCQGCRRPRPMHFQDKDCRKPRPRVLEAKAKARDFCPVELFSWSRTVLQDLIPAGHR